MRRPQCAQRREGGKGMLRRVIGKILHPNPVLSLFAALLTFVSGIQILKLLFGDPWWSKFADLTTPELAGLVGLILVSLLLVRSLASDLWNAFLRERRIVCGSAQAGTSYDYHHLLERDPREVIVVVQNMRTLLSDKDYLPSISKWLARNKDRHPSLTFILSTPKALGALSSVARDHLKQTVVQLSTFLDTEPLRDAITVRCHSGANSLSAFVCDPKSRERGLVVFTPKWAIDVEPANRLYCVIERWEHEDLFNRLCGTIPAMTQSESLTLDQVSRELKA